MATPAVLAKALRLLGEDRVRFVSVGDTEALATVRGDQGDYEVGWDGRDWWCSCDNPKKNCSHITACKVVVRVFGISTN